MERREITGAIATLSSASGVAAIIGASALNEQSPYFDMLLIGGLVGIALGLGGFAFLWSTALRKAESAQKQLDITKNDGPSLVKFSGNSLENKVSIGRVIGGEDWSAAHVSDDAARNELTILHWNKGGTDMSDADQPYNPSRSTGIYVSEKSKNTSIVNADIRRVGVGIENHGTDTKIDGVTIRGQKPPTSEPAPRKPEETVAPTRKFFGGFSFANGDHLKP